MSLPSPYEYAQKSASGLPHNQVINLIRNTVGKIFRFKPRTRAILVFIGSICIVGSWGLPWYATLYFLKTNKATTVAVKHGYDFTNLSDNDPWGIKYGFNAVTNEFSGSDLAHGTPLMRSLVFSEREFYWWVLLAALSLIAVKTYEWRGESRIRDIVSRIVDGGKAVSLLVVIAQCVWKAGSLTSVAKVQAMATATFVAQLKTGGVSANSIRFINTGLSAGFLSLLLGLIFAFLGVFSTKRRPKLRLGIDPGTEPVPAGGPPDETDARIRISAGLIAFLALTYLAVSIALF